MGEHGSIGRDGDLDRDAAAATDQGAASTARGGDDPFIDSATIGELMYGARATLGKMSLVDVERDLRIKAKFLQAIERVDIERLPSTAYIASFVRTYARYLEDALPLSPDQAVAKFAKEYEEKSGQPLNISMEPPSRGREPGFGPRPKQTTEARDKDARGAKPSKKTPEADDPPPHKAPSAFGAGLPGARAGGSRLGARSQSGWGAAAPPTPPGASTVKPIPKKLFEGRSGGRSASRGLSSVPSYAPLREPILTRVAGLSLAAVAVGIVGGLAYGAWSILESAQRVKADDVTAAAAVAERRDVLSASDQVARPAASAYENGLLVGIAEPPPLIPSDAPIAELDPAEVGAFAGAQIASPPLGAAAPTASGALLDGATAFSETALSETTLSAETPQFAETTQLDASALMPPPTAPPLVGLAEQEIAAATAALETTAPPQSTIGAVVTTNEPAFALRAEAPVWVRIENGLKRTLFSGNLEPGEMRDLPIDEGQLRLRTGNAGGTLIVVRGVAYGPLGPNGHVRTLSISRDEVVARFQQNPDATDAIAREYAERLAADADGGALQ